MCKQQKSFDKKVLSCSFADEELPMEKASSILLENFTNDEKFSCENGSWSRINRHARLIDTKVKKWIEWSVTIFCTFANHVERNGREREREREFSSFKFRKIDDSLCAELWNEHFKFGIVKCFRKLKKHFEKNKKNCENLN